MSTIATSTGARSRRRSIGVVAVLAVLLAGCGSSGGDAAAKPEKDQATTTTKVEKTTTTKPSDEDEEEPEEDAPDGLPTDEADAPSGDWISVRFTVAIEPEPEDFNRGAAETRLYDVSPDCDDDGCTLDLEPGGDDGSFTMPGTEPVKGESIVLEPEGGKWTETYEYPDAVGCTDELDGPYIESTEERELEPVYDEDGEISGLVGTVLFTDRLNEAGRAAGCPASSEVVYAYATVMAPNEGLGSIDGYSVDGTFRQTLEVTSATNQVDPMFQKGGISTTFPKYDAELAGSCEDGECSVEFSQLNGDDEMRQTELLSEDGRSLVGTYEEDGGCVNPVTKESVFESGAYTSTGAFEDLTPIWVEDGEVKAFVGKYYRVTEPTELGMTDPSCSEEESLEAWVYLVDTDVLG